MKIAFESDFMMPSVSRAISILTDRARVCVEDIHYDKSIGVVEISIQRRDLTGFKKALFGERRPFYSRKMIKTKLKIWHVEEVDFTVDDRLATENNSCFTVLFGLKFDDKQMYLGSVEEFQGNILCQITIRVIKFRIEFCDEIESNSQ